QFLLIVCGERSRHVVVRLPQLLLPHPGKLFFPSIDLSASAVNRPGVLLLEICCGGKFAQLLLLTRKVLESLDATLFSSSVQVPWPAPAVHSWPHIPWRQGPGSLLRSP